MGIAAAFAERSIGTVTTFSGRLKVVMFALTAAIFAPADRDPAGGQAAEAAELLLAPRSADRSPARRRRRGRKPSPWLPPLLP